jgi:hypothetical protein
MELRHKGVLYEFDYDFAPNTGESTPVQTQTRAGNVLGGSVHITAVYRGGQLTPVSPELLDLLEDSAAEDAIASLAADRDRWLRARRERAQRRRSQVVEFPRG